RTPARIGSLRSRILLKCGDLSRHSSFQRAPNRADPILRIDTLAFLSLSFGIEFLRSLSIRLNPIPGWLLCQAKRWPCRRKARMLRFLRLNRAMETKRAASRQGAKRRESKRGQEKGC